MKNYPVEVVKNTIEGEFDIISGELPVCVGCGVAIDHNWPRTGTLEQPVCMRCEFSEIDVYEVRLNGSSFVERDVQQIIPLLESMDSGDEVYSVGKVRMKLAKYITLPEFEGF